MAGRVKEVDRRDEAIVIRGPYHLESERLEASFCRHQHVGALNLEREVLDPVWRCAIFDVPRVVGAFEEGDAATVLHLEKDVDMRAVSASGWHMVLAHCM